jgi:hypothetical protein
MQNIFLCADQSKPKCCNHAAGMESWDFLKKKRLKERQLVKVSYSNRYNAEIEEPHAVTSAVSVSLGGKLI